MRKISELKIGAHIHLMGICGTAMASLAGLLKDRGFKLTGSDSNPYPPMSTQLASLGIEIQKPYRAENLHPKPDFVIVGNVISKNNPEAVELEKIQVPYTSLAQAMGELIIADREAVVISGTHGKTTTTSLMAWVATELGQKPGYMIGGIPKNFSRSFQNPEGRYFIIEGDEYDTAFFDKVPKFVHYKPRHVVLTSVEFDHADIYKDLQAVRTAFLKLMSLIPKNGNLVYWGDDQVVADIAAQCSCSNKFSYGFGEVTYRITQVENLQAVTRFELHKGKEKIGNFEIPLSGQYNVLNATAVIVMSLQFSWPQDQVRQALESFQGVKRRQEILGEPNGVLIIEDFAHHPTAVRETILGIKQRYPKRKLFAVFEPRSATSRRRVFQDDYAKAFGKCEEIVLAEPFDQSKIEEGDRFSVGELVLQLQKSGKSAKSFADTNAIVNELTEKTRKGDLVLIMSNGGFDGIYQKLIQSLTARG